MYFIDSDDAKILVLQTSEFGFLRNTFIKNFQTSGDGKNYTFSLDGFDKSWATPPSYINEWLGGNYLSIESVKATSKPTTGVYNIATETLTFTYNTIATVVGKYEEGGEEIKKNIKYEYTVKKRH